MKAMEKTYSPQSFEKRIYQKWLDEGNFKARVNPDKMPFTIVLPPPNITGRLHEGHALNHTMQDILIRYKRMKGFETLWLPGTDHASIATEVKILDQVLKEEGRTKDELTREEFLEKAWAWKDKYGGEIVEQMKRLGNSCDWDRERFTMDEVCSKAVIEVFVRLYEEGLIYKGNRLINWCPTCGTSLSDAEVDHEDVSGAFYDIAYPVAGSDEQLIISTTRPETMLADTAVAVHPEDPRYQHLIGQRVRLPLMDRLIPVVADDYVDRELGTGALKVTPAHDPNDYEIGQRHGLEVINIFTEDAKVNEAGGSYAGLDRYEARKQVVKDLKDQGYLIGQKDHLHAVGHCYRCHKVVEPRISDQWFVAMQELAKQAKQSVERGEMSFVPPRYVKIYNNWLDNIRDWNISRQLWWGHRIPAYYCDSCQSIAVAREMPDVCPDCGGEHFTQDPDVLDTWFSSALWPFSTLGWPDESPDLNYFYPTDVLVTGYDIIFFWVIRMIFSGYEQMGERPFKSVLFHGLVRDSQGRKMSKSLGNGIDPLQIIRDYGADALRMTLITGNAPGNDMRFYDERVIANRNFANKIWNASRFIMMNLPEEGSADEAALKALIDADKVPAAIQAEDKWILSRLNDTVQAVTDNMDKYELGIAVQKIYDFMWDEFCDWYIEMVKPRLYKTDDMDSRMAALWTLQKVLITGLKLLHPYMPFITEEIFTTVQSSEESIMISSWPVFREDLKFSKEEETIENIKDAVRAVRAVRNDRQVAPSRKAKIFVVSDKNEVLDMFSDNKVFFETLASASDTVLCTDKSEVPDGALSVILPFAALYLPLADLMDVSAEIARLEKEEKRLQGELKRSAGMLSNEKFLAKAPAAKIEAEREKQRAYEEQMKGVREELENLKKLG